MNWWRRVGAVGTVAIAILILVSGCQASASGSPTGSAEASASEGAGSGEASLDAPDEVEAGADFEVEWTGPDGPQDYITIVPAGSPDGTYLDYAYTAEGSPITLTAPNEPGNYEIWYASDREDGTFARFDIVVR